MNVADSELVTSILNEKDFETADCIDEADVIIFNTCSVRQHAEDRVIGRINNESARKQQKKDLKIGVIGCMAQRLGKSLQEQNNKIDFVVGVDQYKKLPEIISNLFENPHFEYDTIVNNQEIYEDLYPIHTGKYNAFITIMRGCNNFCSYCIVPYTRGRERSRPVQEILTEIDKVGKQGFKDVTLLGQNVNSYNFEEVNFAELLRRANQIESIKRIRFVTSHPKDLSDEVIEVMAESEKVCEHLHLAMQSGDDEILKRMNRGYTAEHYFNIVQKLRKAMPEIAITTDVIAGFPGESEEQFQRTYDLMKIIEFDYAFTFKYSPRTGTKAAEFTDQIPEEIRLKRLQKLIDLQQKITQKKYQDQIGKMKQIYVEKVSKKSDKELAGKSRDFKITVFPGDKSLIGKFVDVKIIEATGWTLRGSMQF
ncbi:MAG: tRNA (N6-isopentenyl adenosine(37)-C2)-methylthiotransferase MiaB [Candidatus Cloacimonetes bacterium]|nr:tRNA (N6-isopentenyl adenosine(37)-C2)-methylthiotransferase MiaB [Candidatus Cloacimonadota bacterium]MCF7814099.1 tRNA (N6-isopentenyl adenosine(37)-C2)-methylthiotransferase MiaB [Candidatus Cloacimonadota bacterium]MCF7867972.1 tRNA (N6-isopentenyl adenosine(37)-C2)-methylthiotransferase MiaB [Candidatus Cloacimonadota bacterium]MCF7883430.1 tRNA (N6-isopentenyl adenosine(37)-C2)-methylthiotransferase MiaB [Candidatus Cloacimonadota bacterium]